MALASPTHARSPGPIHPSRLNSALPYASRVSLHSSQAYIEPDTLTTHVCGSSIIGVQGSLNCILQILEHEIEGCQATSPDLPVSLHKFDTTLSQRRPPALIMLESPDGSEDATRSRTSTIMSSVLPARVRHRT